MCEQRNTIITQTTKPMLMPINCPRQAQKLRLNMVRRSIMFRCQQLGAAMIHAECGRCIRERLLENRHEVESFRSPLLTLLGVINKGDTGRAREGELSEFIRLYTDLSLEEWVNASHSDCMQVLVELSCRGWYILFIETRAGSLMDDVAGRFVCRMEC